MMQQHHTLQEEVTRMLRYAHDTPGRCGRVVHASVTCHWSPDRSAETGSRASIEVLLCPRSKAFSTAHMSTIQTPTEVSNGPTTSLSNKYQIMYRVCRCKLMQASKMVPSTDCWTRSL